MPNAWAGLTAVICVLVLRVALVAGVVPNRTVSVPLQNWVPVMITVVPP
jgi:hypothetical protein